MSEEKLSPGQFIGFLREKKSLWLIAAALALGIGLMLFGSADSAQTVSAAASEERADTTELESRVKNICERIAGVSDVAVMITLDTLGEQLYALDSQISLDGDKKEQRMEYVTVSQGLVPVGERTARVMGVAIVCSGGDDAGVQLKLTNLITALFDIPSNAVSIVGAG